uniref:Uncharacterized protein OSJNBb0035K09.16 n=2 Tax=Oryza sativa subsp. japonica TaxID=39947 RepID=Q69KC9_ORYSJ|nr:hypothetical protein [Oryza sativa Japonica Group]BAD69450.1 hypothetical protein [Oryza sativa Japonica Group]
MDLEEGRGLERREGGEGPALSSVAASSSLLTEPPSLLVELDGCRRLIACADGRRLLFRRCSSRPLLAESDGCCRLLACANGRRLLLFRRHRHRSSWPLLAESDGCRQLLVCSNGHRLLLFHSRRHCRCRLLARAKPPTATGSSSR